MVDVVRRRVVVGTGYVVVMMGVPGCPVVVGVTTLAMVDVVRRVVVGTGYVVVVMGEPGCPVVVGVTTPGLGPPPPPRQMVLMVLRMGNLP